MDAYESWVRGEMDAAQAKLDDMSRALDIYLAWRKSQQGISMQPLRVHIRPGVMHSSGAPRQRASKNDVIFEAFEAAGAAGLSQDDVQRVARENGLNSSPDTLRALCWNGKNKGRLISVGVGRYAIAPKNEAAVENLEPGETAAPARADNNRHREGDEGGGT